MGRHAQGWKLVAKPNTAGGITYHVRFRVRGRRTERTTGEGSPGKAARRAAVIYASAVDGRLVPSRRLPAGLPGRPLEELADAWLEGLRTSLDPATVDGYTIYVRHLLAHFPTVHGMTTAGAEAYARKRLGIVVRGTVRKELSALRGFLEWCKGASVIAEVPLIRTPPKNVVGVRYDVERKTEATPLTQAEVQRVLAALPEKTRKVGAGKARDGAPGRFRRPRDYFTVLWETGLRPITVRRLEVPTHYTRGARELTITDEIDKARYGRKLPLTPAARAALDASCPDKGKPGPIFVGKDFRKTLDKAAGAARLAPEKVANFSGYDFRHARATDLVHQTGDLPGTAYLMGHKQLTTTNRYLHPSREAGDRVLAALSGADSGAGVKSRVGSKRTK